MGVLCGSRAQPQQRLLHKAFNMTDALMPALPGAEYKALCAPAAVCRNVLPETSE